MNKGKKLNVLNAEIYFAATQFNVFFVLTFFTAAILVGNTEVESKRVIPIIPTEPHIHSGPEELTILTIKALKQ